MPAKKAGQVKPAPLFADGIYVCPRCKQRIQIFVKLNAPPVCWNHFRQEMSIMERLENAKKK